jgi:uncharacterized protein (DUF58 family)
MALIMAALQFQNEVSHRRDKTGSKIASALAGAQRLLKKRSLVVVISDFFSVNWEHEMTELCRKHDVIVFRITDTPELPYPGLITLEDPETGIRIDAPGGLNSFKEAWKTWLNERSIQWEAQCKRCGVSFMELSTAEDAPSVLFKFFGSRNQNKYR